MDKRTQLRKATQVATEAHSDQTYGGGEYMAHVRRVSRGVGLTMVERVVAVLHDVVEDAGDRFPMTHLTALLGLSETQVAALDAITRREDETYSQYIGRVGKDRLATKIKLLDIEDHLQHEPPESLKQRYLKARLRLKLYQMGKES